MSEYDQMRRSEELDDDGVLPEELEEEAENSATLPFTTISN